LYKEVDFMLFHTSVAGVTNNQEDTTTQEIGPSIITPSLSFPPTATVTTTSTTTRKVTIPSSPSRSLGTGILNRSKSAVSHFVPSPERKGRKGTCSTSSSMTAATATGTAATTTTRSHSMNEANIDENDHHRQIVFKRAYSSFLRVADLEMDETISMKSDSIDSAEQQQHPNFHHISADPPPGIETDPKERWVVLDDGEGNHAPIAPMAVAALARIGQEIGFNKEMWMPDGKTAKVLKNQPEWNNVVWNKEGPVCLPEAGKGVFNEKETLVWSGSFKHSHYGSELPAVRSVGIIDMAPRDLFNLLVDSSRVKEYNKLCVGRTDLLVLQKEMDVGAFGGITKIMKTQTKPPVIRRILQFTSLMHGRELGNSGDYELVTRAVTLPEDKEDLANALKSEILLAATIIKRIEGNDNRCLFITVNHLRTPMIPMMIAKRIGLQAAAGFIGDLRSCCGK